MVWTSRSEGSQLPQFNVVKSLMCHQRGRWMSDPVALLELPTSRFGGRFVPETSRRGALTATAPPMVPAEPHYQLHLLPFMTPQSQHHSKSTDPARALLCTTNGKFLLLQRNHSTQTTPLVKHSLFSEIIWTPAGYRQLSAHFATTKDPLFPFKCVSAELKSTKATEAHLHTIKGVFLGFSEPPRTHQACKGGRWKRRVGAKATKPRRFRLEDSNPSKERSNM